MTLSALLTDFFLGVSQISTKHLEYNFITYT
jgi:hypothetical protein